MLRLLLVLSLFALSSTAFTPSLPGRKLRARFSSAREASQSITRRLGSVAADLLLSEPAQTQASPAVTQALFDAPSAHQARASARVLKIQPASLTPVQKASADAWMKQFERTREIGVGYYNAAAAAGDARVQAVTPVRIPEEPSVAHAPYPTSPHTRAPAPQLDARRAYAPAYAPAQPAYTPAPSQQMQRQGATAPQAARPHSYARPHQSQPYAADSQSTRYPTVREEVAQRRSAGTSGLLKQGLAGAALRAKQQNELEAFRASFLKHRLPTERR